MSTHEPVAIIVRCLICKAIELAKVTQQPANWPMGMERMPVSQVREAAWCRCQT